MVDLMAILPFFLEFFLHHLLDLRFLRVFRLLRLLKLTRYTGATTTLTRVISREWSVLAASAFIMLLLVIMTASLGYLFEHDAQPDKFENIPQSIYWAVITLASVGYGDISPVTTLGKLFASLIMFIGYAIIAVPTGIVTSEMTAAMRHKREQHESCPACGREGHDVDASYCKHCGNSLNHQYQQHQQQRVKGTALAQFGNGGIELLSAML